MSADSKLPVLQFLGAAQTVTGSKFLLYAEGQELLVDMGLFQGLKDLRLRNWDPMPIDPSKIDAAILTHAHVDHVGYLPRLTSQGYRGPVYCTPATRDLAGIILPDSGHLQEEEAEYANRKSFSKHHPALPLYTEQDAYASLARLKTLDYGRELEVLPRIRARFQPTGHILGSASVQVDLPGTRLFFSGDVGGYDSAVMRGPAPIPAGVDVLICESTYGDRVIDHRPIRDQLRDILRPVLDRGGIVVIPAFAVGRTTVLLYHLREAQEKGDLPDAPVFVDSPMATDAADIYGRYAGEHNLRVDLLADPARSPIRSRRIYYTRSVQESIDLNRHAGPAIIVSASGMATGGRVVHHLKHKLPDPKNLVLLVGYQGIGTRGRALLDGAASVRIHGQDVPVRAQVSTLQGLSAHGDADDLLRWLKTAPQPPKRVYLVHGEPDAQASFADRIRRELDWEAKAPAYLEKISLL